jgi:hypothetical protein
MLARDGVPIHWRTQPFTGPVHRALRPSGMSIAEIVQSVPDLPVRFLAEGEVHINGQMVPRDLWPMVRPRVRYDFEIVVTLHVRARGGGGQGGSKNPLATLAAIALLVVTTVITGGILGPAGALSLSGTYFAAGSVSATLLAAGVGVIGSLALAALSPPPVQSAENPTGSNETADSNTPASLQGNVLARGAAISCVVGEHRVYPSLAAPPLVEATGMVEKIEALYILSGAHRLRDIRIAGMAIDDITDLEYEVIEGLPGDGNSTMVTRQSYSDGPSVELSRHDVDPTTPTRLVNQLTPSRSVPTWSPVATRLAPDEAWMVLAFSEGLADYNAPTTAIGTPIRIQVRQKGTGVWINLPEIHFSSKSGLPFQKVIKFKWDVPPLLQSLAPTDEGPYLAIKTVPGQTVAPPTGGWIANDYFSRGAGSDVYSAATYGTHNVSNILLYQDSVEVYLDPMVFPKGTYEINVRQGTAYTVASLTPAAYTYGGTVYDFFEYYTSAAVAVLPRTRAQIHDKCTISRVTSIWNEHPIAAGKFAQIAIRAKNRSIGQLSVLAGRYVKDWNGTDWGDLVVTDNPAPHLIDVMTGGLNADPLPPALVDNDALVAWRQACIDNDYTINAVIETGSVDDARLLIASCGWARPAQSETWGIIRDKDRSADVPAQIFSMRNLSSFRWEKAFPRLPDGFRVIFNNRDIDFAEDEVIVLRNGINPEAADRLEETRYAGMVTTDEVTRRAEFDLAQLAERSTFYYGNADAESIVCRRGDLVGVQHDIISHWAGSARIMSVIRDGDDVTGLVLDGSVPAPGSARFLMSKGSRDVLLADDDTLLLAGPGELLDLGGQESFLKPRTFLQGHASGIAIRRTDGMVTVKPLVDIPDATETKTLTFASPLADPDELIQPDCLVTTGILGQEYRRLIVLDIAPGKDLTADITFVDEAPKLWT